MTVEYIRELLRPGCQYCGEKTGKIGLDRVQNSVGHTPENVIPACSMCNLMRRDMPHEAWTFLLPRILEAKQAGLFGSWTGTIWESGGAPGI